MDPIITENNPLSIFHPLVRSWFEMAFKVPTDIQLKAWPIISKGEHVLISAPTGTGKTLTAFLWSINQLITGAWDQGTVRVLYISPLKALNTDIRENLLTPLHDIRKIFVQHNQQMPLLRVMTRSGDTSAKERASMVRRPPEILITTPESLNLIISSPRARKMLSGLTTVILDEIHAVASDKRGALLSTAIERLVPLCGEFQRIALSATVHPLETTARFAGGFYLINDADVIRYEPRPVTILTSGYKKKIQLTIEGLQHETSDPRDGESVWHSLAYRLSIIISRNRSTLIFVNNRRLAERMVMYINNLYESPCVYSHHGSLSRELRQEVEKRLKAGILKAIVATSSLEMGIDIGEIDEVVLVQTPVTVSSSLQRIGRAGHSVHRVSRGTMLPTHGLDLLYAAVMVVMTKSQDIEKIHLITSPLDILAQVLLSMCGLESYTPDDLYNFIRTSAAFNSLSRRQFDLVLMMLAGKYEETRIRELSPRLIIDQIENKIQAKQGALRLIYSGGGTIPDKGYFELRVQGTNAKIGELDEEFVWERRVGDTFLMGTQNWRIEKINDKDVEVSLWHGQASMSPFWKADALNRSYHVSSKTAEFLEKWNDQVDSDIFIAMVTEQCGMDSVAAESLRTWLQFQKKYTGPKLPHRHHIIIEHVSESDDGIEPHTILHTLWGNTVNFPFMLALAKSWEDRYHKKLNLFTSNEAIFIQAIITSEEIKSLVDAGNVNALLKKSLEQSSFFGARFRENSGRALLLPRSDPQRRIPHWITRQRSKKLLQSVQRYSDFPLIAETWRTCLQDEFDIEALTSLLVEIHTGEITITTVSTSTPSPFSGTLQHQFTNKFLYEDDTPHKSSSVTSLSQDIFDEVTFSSSLRPEFSRESIDNLQSKLHRTQEGYSPAELMDLIEWVNERICIPSDEWDSLRLSLKNDVLVQDVIDSNRVIQISLPNARTECIVTVENAHLLARLFSTTVSALLERANIETRIASKVLDLLKNKKSQSDVTDESGLMDMESLFSRWLAFYGPVKPFRLTEVFGLTPEVCDQLIDNLCEQKLLVKDIAVKNEEDKYISDAQNCERLVRIARKSAQPTFTPLQVQLLPLLIAKIQGLTEDRKGISSLGDTIQKLFHLPAKAALWEEAIFPARIKDYQPHMLTTILTNSDLEWFGCSKEQIAFRLKDDREISGITDKRILEGIQFKDPNAKYSYGDLHRASGLDSATFLVQFWKCVWSGYLTSDTFEAVRTGIMLRFGKDAHSEENARFGNSNDLFVQYKKAGALIKKTSRIIPGNWYTYEINTPEPDPIYQDDLCRERIRILFSRYGILFRELLVNELSVFQWSRIFRTLRIMELSGEILTGHFFENIPGLQFISHEAFRVLKDGLDENVYFWMSAADPASFCGSGIQALKADLPERQISTHLFNHGSRLVIVSRKGGKVIECRFSHDDKNAIKYCSMIKVLADKNSLELNNIRIESINGESVYDSVYTKVFEKAGFVLEYKYLTYWPGGN